MEKMEIEWNEFVSQYGSQDIRPFVDLNKGHALIKSPLGPRNWRVIIHIVTWLFLLAIPTALVLFFFVKWWIPIIVIVFSLMTNNVMRKVAAKAVLETSLESPSFYRHAILSGTMKIYPAKRIPLLDVFGHWTPGNWTPRLKVK
jgi:hypothetical protein